MLYKAERKMAGRFPALMRRLVSCSILRSGGVDFEAAGRLGVNAQRALSLPGRVAPQAAGEIIKTTIYHMIEEGAE